MKKCLLLLIVTTALLSCSEKGPTIDSVYDYITYVVITSSSKTGPVKLEMTSSYGKSSSKWMALITKSGESCTVKFYESGRVGNYLGDDIEELDYQFALDTTFTITLAQFKDNMLLEEELNKNRPIIDDVYKHIKISRKHDEKKFGSRDIGGLKEIFRYNKFYLTPDGIEKMYPRIICKRKLYRDF